MQFSALLTIERCEVKKILHRLDNSIRARPHLSGPNSAAARKLLSENRTPCILQMINGIL